MTPVQVHLRKSFLELDLPMRESISVRAFSKGFVAQYAVNLNAVQSAVKFMTALKISPNLTAFSPMPHTLTSEPLKSYSKNNRYLTNVVIYEEADNQVGVKPDEKQDCEDAGKKEDDEFFVARANSRGPCPNIPDEINGYGGSRVLPFRGRGCASSVGNTARTVSMLQLPCLSAHGCGLSRFQTGKCCRPSRRLRHLRFVRERSCQRQMPRRSFRTLVFGATTSVAAYQNYSFQV